MSEFKLVTDRVNRVIKHYDDGAMFDRLYRANIEDSRNIVCDVFNINEAINAYSVIRCIQIAAKNFGTDVIREIQVRMVSADWEGDIFEFKLGENSNLSVKMVAEVVPNGNKVWNIILEADSKQCHLSYLLGHITKSGQQAAFKILNLVTRTDKDVIPAPDPNRVILSKGKVIELTFNGNSDDIPTEIILGASDNGYISKVTLKEHVVTEDKYFNVLEDVTSKMLDEGFEHLVEAGILVPQRKILSRGEIITKNSIADLLTDRLPSGFNISLIEFDEGMYVILTDIFVDTFAKAKNGTLRPCDLGAMSIDDRVKNYESINVLTDTVTDEYKEMHPNSVFEGFANGVTVEFVKKSTSNPAGEPVGATEAEPPAKEPDLLDELLKGKEGHPDSDAETREELPPPPAEIPAEPEDPNLHGGLLINLKAGDIIEFVSVDPEAGVVRIEAVNSQYELTDPNFNSEFKYGKYRVKEDISDCLASYEQLHELMEKFEEVQEQPKEEQQVEEQKEPEEQLNDIGTDPKDLPPPKRISEECSVNDFLQILFGTSSPTILHVFKILNKYGKSSPTYQLTQTFPTIVDVIFTKPAYHFSIVRMKNGCYYKVFVAHTDLERENHGCWEDTHGEKDRWYHLINISDRQVNEAFRGRM